MKPQDSDSQSFEVLVAALKGDDLARRSAAADALGRSANPRAVQPLAAAVRDKDKWARIAKAHETNQHRVSALLCEDEKMMRSCAVAALRNLGEVGISELLLLLTKGELDSRSPAAEALGELGDKRAVEPLLAALQTEDWNIRVSVCEALGKLRDPRAVPALIAALRDRHKQKVRGPDGEEYDSQPVRHAAAKALEQIGGAEAQRAASEFWSKR